MKLGELLVSRGKLSARDVDRALMAQQELGGLLGQVLVKLGLVSEIDMTQVLGDQLGIPLAPSATYSDTLSSVEGLSREFLLNHKVVVLEASSDTLCCAAAVPQDPFIRRALELATSKTVTVLLGVESDIQAALQRQCGNDDPLEPDSPEEPENHADFVEHLRDLASEAPVIRIVNNIFHRAVELNASDIHLEPCDGGLHLRYRVDGVIEQANNPPPPGFSASITSRIKLLANLDIAERRLPQDGRIMIRVKGRELDLRVSTLPILHGESIVLRVLDCHNVSLNLATMGFDPVILDSYRQLLARPHGILLLTGPTGSGKTTTLYASLASFNADAINIITVEDPVEYQLPGINQLQVHPGIDLSFARALRAILRQDPDVIMIGEMRDVETARIAVQAALTGHLVFSTLHTNTAAGAITRLEDMGIERYLITATVNGVLAQRLVRRLCNHCRQPLYLSPKVTRDPELAKWLTMGPGRVYQAGGCEHCRFTGYRGRSAIHELLVLDKALQDALHDGCDAMELHSLARQKGMSTLYQDGLRKVTAGITSLEEVMRVSGDQQIEAASHG